MLKTDLAIFSAMPEELEFFQLYFSECRAEIVQAAGFDFIVYYYKNQKILLAATGLGTAFAASVTTLVCQHFHPDYIFLSGTAGGIKAELNLRDVIVAEKAFEAEIQGAFSILKGTPFESCLTHPLKKSPFPSTYSADTKLLNIANAVSAEGTKAHLATVVSSNTFPAPKELFEKIKSQAPYSIDMETSAFYQVAWLLGIPALAVRGISNLLDHDGSDEKVHESDVAGSARTAADMLIKIINKLILQLAFKITNEDEELNTLINQFDLKPHPEGGFFKRSYQSSIVAKSIDEKRYEGASRFAGTAIYYLLNKTDFSAFHRIKSDETWHYYKGSPVILHVITPLGELQKYLLGDPTIHENAVFQKTIPADHWFAAENSDKNTYSFVGCTVSLGFDFLDFELADRKLLSTLFPSHKEIIKKFTRMSETSTSSVKCFSKL